MTGNQIKIKPDKNTERVLYIYKNSIGSTQINGPIAYIICQTLRSIFWFLFVCCLHLFIWGYPVPQHTCGGQETTAFNSQFSTIK